MRLRLKMRMLSVVIIQCVKSTATLLCEKFSVAFRRLYFSWPKRHECSLINVLPPLNFAPATSWQNPISIVQYDYNIDLKFNLLFCCYDNFPEFAYFINTDVIKVFGEIEEILWRNRESCLWIKLLFLDSWYTESFIDFYPRRWEL